MQEALEHVHAEKDEESGASPGAEADKSHHGIAGVDAVL
jgi:hypothetical protein